MKIEEKFELFLKDPILKDEIDKINAMSFVGFINFETREFPIFKDVNGNNVVLGQVKDWPVLESLCSVEKIEYFIIHAVLEYGKD